VSSAYDNLVPGLFGDKAFAVVGAAAGSVPAVLVEKFLKETMETVETTIQEVCSVLN
jgi:3-oxoacyl-ACP reductase-like protein